MSVYEKKATGSLMSYMLAEQHLYGSSRLGMRNPNLEMIGAIANADTAKMYLGIKNYELSNHLGNVLTVISDKKIQMDVNNDNVVDYYVADIISASDYYPFGSSTPGRSFSSGSYRYGFNGKENDNEVKGTRNQQDYGMRIYDTRLGRFLSVDPLFKDFAWNSSFAFAEGNPIQFIDLDGLEKAKNTATRRTKPILDHKNFNGGGLVGLFGGTRGKYLKHWDLGKNKVEGVSPAAKKPTYHMEESEKIINNPLEKDWHSTLTGDNEIIPKYKQGTLKIEVQPPTAPEGEKAPEVTLEYGVKDVNGNIIQSQTIKTSEKTNQTMDFNLKEGDYIYTNNKGCEGCTEKTGGGGTKVSAETKIKTKVRVKDE
ncbi:MAG: RHS repeat-associated core domain-containing protein [Bacteroidia bacterium]|nr:RHS repeat-associated core domain-containing protein [Bacteroidia bacterium]